MKVRSAIPPGVSLVLVPSGETAFSRQGRLVGGLDVPLSDRGRKGAHRILEEDLRALGGVDAVYSSPAQSARETAEVLARADSHRIRIADGLGAVSLGLWEGQLEVEVRLRHQRAFERWREDPLAVTPPEGEDMASADERAWKAVRAILKRHRIGTIVLVAPPTVIGLVYCRLNGLAASRVFDVTGRLGSFEVLRAAASR